MISNHPLSGSSDASPLPLAGQLALITGGAKRLGRAIAIELCAAGMDVVIHYRRSAADADQLAALVRKSGRLAWTLAADLDDPQAAENLVAGAASLTGRPVDLLVNNAALYAKGDFGEFSAAQLHEQVNVNAAAPLLAARGFAAQRRPGGSIINLLDARMVDYDRAHLAYHLSKRMLLSITQLLALELAPDVRVNGVAPGVILPDEGQDESTLAAMSQTTPLRRHGDPADVARAVRFLAECSFITGQIIYVDGGRHLRGRVYGD